MFGIDLMPRGVRTDSEISAWERREKVVRLRSQGTSVPRIAKECGTSTFTVQDDLRLVRAEWLRMVARNKAAWMAEALSDLNTLIRTAWEDYLGVGETVLGDTPRGRTRRRKKKDPRLLTVIADALKQRNAILGLGDQAAKDRMDEVLSKRTPKLLVIRDRQQAQDLVDVTQLVELDIRGQKIADENPDGAAGQSGELAE